MGRTAEGWTPDGWTPDGWTPDGWTTEGWTLDGWTAAGVDRRTRTTNPGDRTPERLDTGRAGHRTGWTPDGWTAGSRTTNRMGGHRMPDTGDRRHGGVLAVSTTATAPDRWMPAEAPAGRGRRGGVRPGPFSSTDDEGTTLLRAGPGHRRDGQLQVVRHRPVGASAHCCPQTNFGSSVERDGGVQVLWRAHMWAGAVAVGVALGVHRVWVWIELKALS
jgi:hypothetical protein